MSSHSIRAFATCVGLLWVAQGTLAPETLARSIDIGVTAAVRPNATGTPPELETRILQVGLDLTADERIDTGPRGQTHLLFRDGSALTVGPNSSVVLDTFVYDPETKRGELVMSASKGLFRFVGGRISKTRPVMIKTPTAVIGIRGGVAMMEVNGAGPDGAPPADPVSVTMIFGDEVTMQTTGGGPSRSMTRPGFTMVQSPDGGIGEPAPATQQQLGNALSRLEEPQGQDDEDTPLGEIAPAGGGPTVSDDDVAGAQISELGSNNNPAALTPQVAVAPPPTVNVLQSEIAIASQQQPVNDSLLPPGDTPGDDDDPDSSGSGSGAGGASTLAAVAGRVKGGISSQVGSNDNNALDNFAIVDSSLGDTLNFQTPDNEIVSLPVQPGSFTVSPGQFLINGVPQTSAELGAGSGVLNADGDFIYYELDEFDADDGLFRDLIYAGIPTPDEAFPGSGTSTYTLLPDFVLGSSEIPFASPAFFSGMTALVPSTAPQALINWNDSGGTTYPVLYSSTVVINGQGSSQQSIASMTLGRVMQNGDGKYFINGDNRGSAWVSPFSDSGIGVYFGGGASSADNGLGNDFFGLSGPNNFVLEGAGVSDQDQQITSGVEAHLAISTPLTYFPNVIATSDGGAPVATTRSTRTLNGYTAGFTQEWEAGNDFLEHLPIELANLQPTDFILNTNAATNTASVSMHLEEFGPGFETNFVQMGDFATMGHSAFIDDWRFGLRESAGTSEYTDGINVLTDHSYMITGDQVSLQNALPSNVSSICTCEYTVWGFWGIRVTYDDGTNDFDGSRTEGHLIPFVAGDLIDAAQLNINVIATYQGTVIGTVVNGSATMSSSAVYKAIGNIDMDLQINAGSVLLQSGTITGFDGSNLSLAPGGFNAPPYGFNISGTAGGVAVTGNGSGHFVGPGTPPENTIGEGAVSGANYEAEFVYFGELTAIETPR